MRRHLTVLVDGRYRAVPMDLACCVWGRQHLIWDEDHRQWILRDAPHIGPIRYCPYCGADNE